MSPIPQEPQAPQKPQDPPPPAPSWRELQKHRESEGKVISPLDWHHLSSGFTAQDIMATPPGGQPTTAEQRFMTDYKAMAEAQGLSPDPDDPLHHYDYREAWRAGMMEPDESGHFPSQFKSEDHPNRYVEGIDTITGEPEVGREPEIQQAPAAGALASQVYSQEDQLFQARQQPPPPRPQSPLYDMLYDQGAQLRKATERALAHKDYEGADKLYRQQLLLGAGSNAAQMTAGQDPMQPMPQAMSLMPDVEAMRQRLIMRERDQDIEEILEQERWDLAQAWEQDVYNRYDSHNRSLTVFETPDMTDEERAVMQKQMRPLIIRPEEIAEQDQRLAKINARMKEIDQSFSVFTHPKTQRLAEWMMREANPQTPHYFVRGGEAGGSPSLLMHLGVAADEAGTSVMDLSFKLWDVLTNGGGEAWWSRPTNYTVREGGRLVHNGGRLMASNVIHQMMMGAFYSEPEIRMDWDRMRNSREWYESQRGPLGGILTGAAYLLPQVRVIGGAIGMGMKWGSATTKGLGWMATAGRWEGWSQRMQKITSIVGGTAGAAAGSGAVEMALFGNPQGLAKAFWHGALMAPVYLAFGAGGGALQRMMQRRSMPTKISGFVAGMMEGGGFAMMEVNDFKPLWSFMQDPNRADWDEFMQILGRNMLAFGFLKGMQAKPLLPHQMKPKRPTEVEDLPEVAPQKPLTESEIAAWAAKQEARYADLEAAGAEREDVDALIDLLQKEREARPEGRRPDPQRHQQLKAMREHVERRIRAAQKGYPADVERQRARKERYRRMRETEEYETEAEAKQRQELEEGIHGKPAAPGEKKGKAGIQTRIDEIRNKLRQMLAGKTRSEIPAVKKSNEYRQLEIEKAELFKYREAARAKLALVKARVDRRKLEAEKGLLPLFPPDPTDIDVALTQRLEQQGLSLMGDVETGFDVISPEGLPLPIEVVALRLENAQVGLIERPDGRYDVIDLTEPLKAMPPTEPGGPPWFMIRSVKPTEWVKRRGAPVFPGPPKELGGRPAAEFREAEDIRKARGLPGPERRGTQVGLPEGQPERRLIEEIPTQPPARKQMVQEGGELGLEKPTVGQLGKEAGVEAAREKAEGPPERPPVEAFLVDVTSDDGVKTTVKIRAPSPAMALKKASQMSGIKSGENVREAPDEQLGETRVPAPEGPEPTAARHAAPATGGIGGIAKVPGARPIRASDVALEIQGFGKDPTKFHGIQTEFNQKAMRGYLNTREDIALLENILDIANLGHEWAHQLQVKILGKKWMPDPSIEGMLRDISRAMWAGTRHGRRRIAQEGWAEYWNRDLLGDKDLGLKWPRLHQWMQQWMSQQSPAVQRAYQTRKRVMQQYRDQGSYLRSESIFHWKWEKTSPQAVRARGPHLNNFFWGVNWWMFDNLSGIKRAMKETAKATGVDLTKIPAHLNPYRVASAFKGTAPGEAETWVWKGVLGLDKKVAGPSLTEHLAELTDRDDVKRGFTWTMSKRTLERQDRLLEKIRKEKGQAARDQAELEMMDQPNPISLQTRRDALAYADRFDPATTARYERLAEGIRKYANHMVDYLAESGAWTPKEAQIIKDTDLFYIPFQRAFLGKTIDKHGNVGVSARTGIYRFFGSQHELKDGIQALVDMTVATIRKGQMHQVMKSIYTAHLKFEGLGPLVTEVDRPTRVQEIDLAKIAEGLGRVTVKGDVQHELESLAAQLSEIAGGNAGAMLTLFSRTGEPNSTQPIVPHKVRYTEPEIQSLERNDPVLGAKLREMNGKDVFLHLNPDLYNSLLKLGYTPNLTDVLGPIGSMIRFATRGVKLGATGINPDFIVRNIFRDAMQQPVFSNQDDWSSWLPFSASMKGILRNLDIGTQRELEGARIFRESGGRVATFWGSMLSSEEMVKGMKDPVFKKSLTSVGRLTTKVYKVLSASEMWGRVGEAGVAYRKALDRGASTYEAAIIAIEAGKEVTVDFSRHGTLGRILTQAYPYFNPTLQGGRKTIMRAFGQEGGPKAALQAWAKASIIFGGMSAFSWLMNHMDEESQEAYDDRPIWHRNNYWTLPAWLMGRQWSLPKAFEMGKGIGNPVEWILDTAYGRNPVAAKTVAWDLISGFVPGWPFIGSLISPTVAVTFNKVLWQNRPIVPYYMETTMLPKDQYNQYSTVIAKELGKAFGISPMKIDHWVNAHLGGLWFNGNRVIDEAFSTPPEQPNPEGEADWWAAIPGLSTIIRQVPHRSSRYAHELRNLNDHLRKKAGSRETTREEDQFRPHIRLAIERLSAIGKAERENVIDKETADRMEWALSKPLLDLYDEHVGGRPK